MRVVKRTAVSRNKFFVTDNWCIKFTTWTFCCVFELLKIQQVIHFAALAGHLWLLIPTNFMADVAFVHMLGEVAAVAVRMEDIVSCSCPTFQGIVMKGIGSLSGSAMMETEEEDWAGKQRDDREGGARVMHLSPPAAASKKKKTGRKNNSNS